MKKEHKLDKTISLIKKAISACGADFATTGVRSHLLAALREAGHVSKKRHRREQTAMQEAAAKAVNNYDKWWKQIEENVRKAAEEQKIEPEENSTEVDR